ncbi:hypothetical protein GF312_12770, partial [Candidatus Poribacteria bacterium]|nr:hypothetical protein [Candidatus Poribacteria bacterium]
MKQLTFLTILIICCPTILAQKEWIQKADYGGGERSYPFAFVIDDKGYVGGGTSNAGFHQDFWEYDTSNTWTEKSNVAAIKRNMAPGFSVKGKGYVCTGQDASLNDLDDLWEYDPNTNQWVQKADFPGGARTGAVALSIGEKGYLGFGNYSGDGTKYKDFWAYNPDSNQWSQQAYFPGEARYLAIGFSIGAKGYIGLGTTSGGVFLNDFWEYDPVLNGWTQKADFPGTGLWGATAFNIGDKGYVGCGRNAQDIHTQELWEYDPEEDKWNRRSDLPGGRREHAIGFSIGNSGYIGLGYGNIEYKGDLWQYTYHDILFDERDNTAYPIVKIGNQWWMAENLRAVQYTDGTPLTDGTSYGDISNNDTTRFYFWYDNDSSNNAQTYGALYTWAAAMNGDDSSNAIPSGVQGVCPTGWHLPSDKEWQELEVSLGMPVDTVESYDWRGIDAGGKLKEQGFEHWLEPNTGATNESGFTALPAGNRNSYGAFGGLGGSTYYWSTTIYTLTPTLAWRRYLDNNYSSINRGFAETTRAYSIRCVKDIYELNLLFNKTDVTNLDGSDGSINLEISGGIEPYEILWSNGSNSEDISGLSAGIYTVTVTDARDSTISDSVRVYNTLTDSRDYNTYRAIRIGNQFWMAENLNANIYTDSTTIPLVESSSSWNSLGPADKAYCYYDNNSENGSEYGVMYTWAAAMNGELSTVENPSMVQGVCPSEWHLPSDTEWKEMEMSLGMSQADADAIGLRGIDEGGKLKEQGFEHWLEPNTGATNESGFTAL